MTDTGLALKLTLRLQLTVDPLQRGGQTQGPCVEIVSAHKQWPSPPPPPPLQHCDEYTTLPGMTRALIRRLVWLERQHE